MSDYKIDIRAQLSGFEEIESKINSLKSKPVDIKVNLQGANGDLSKQLQSQMAGATAQFKNAGKNAGNNFAQGFRVSQSQVLKFQEDLLTGKFSANTSKMTAQLKQYDTQSSALLKKAQSYSQIYQKSVSDLSRHFNENDSFKMNDEQVAKSFQNMERAAKTYANTMIEVRNESSKTISATESNTLGNKIQKYYSDNTKAVKEYGTALKNLEAEARSAKTQGDITDIKNRFKELDSVIKSKGLTGKSIFDELGRGFKQIGQFVGTYGALQQTVNVITNSIGELKSIDGILTEISKTSDLTTGQLKTLGETSFDSASKYGKKASDYLTSVQEMSRSGYYGDKAEEMAQLSVLAQAAGDINANAANSYLLASNAAYQYQGNVQKLNAVLDGQNMITNRNSVSMADMAEATTKAASMASELGVQENQLSAMIGTIESRTKAGGDEVGTALKSLLINVENINNAKIADTFKEAGVAQTEYVNGVERMRNPVDILKDLAVVFNSLEESDPLRTDILTNIGQKWQANKLSALLSGWSDYEKMLKDYSEGTGSAAIEAEKSANNWEGATNKLSNTFTGFMQNFVNTDGIIGTTNAITGLVSGFDVLTSKIGPLSLALGGLGLFQGAKGGGKRWKYRPAFIKSTYATGEFSGDVYELCTA